MDWLNNFFTQLGTAFGAATVRTTQNSIGTIPITVGGTTIATISGGSPNNTLLFVAGGVALYFLLRKG